MGLFGYSYDAKKNFKRYVHVGWFFLYYVIGMQDINEQKGICIDVVNV